MTIHIKRYGILALFFALCAVWINTPSAHAESALTETANAAVTSTVETASTTDEALVCELEQALNNLLAINDAENNNIKPEDELAARKEVLVQTVVCSKLEINDLQDRLAGLSLENKEGKAMSMVLLKALTEATEYYNSVESYITDEMTLDKVKALADAVLTWRNNYYLPLLNQINNFYLVTSGNNSLGIAQSRLQKITNVLSILRLNQVAKIKALLTEAAMLTKKAEELNKRARDIVLAYTVASTTTAVFSETATSTGTSTPAATSAQKIASMVKIAVGTSTAETKASSTSKKAGGADTTVTVASLVRESLMDIKSAYNNYLQISDLVKKILGL